MRVFSLREITKFATIPHQEMAISYQVFTIFVKLIKEVRVCQNFRLTGAI